MLEAQAEPKSTSKSAITGKVACKSTAVDNWLAERTRVIVMYCKLSGYRNQTKLPESVQINGFCDILIDYVSAGHFEVYEQIVNDCDVNGPSSIQLLNKLYPDISKTTDIVVDFNEKYAKTINSDDELMSRFDTDLSALGEAIAKRVDLEDNLIDTLNTNH
ncbi:MAG: sigma D regulator [Kangiellaceae bacterium]|nr:sigma D regulator [Kangiellaceae bacterium]